MNDQDHEGPYEMVASETEYPGLPWPLLTERQVAKAEERWQAALGQLLEAGREETEP